MSDPTSSGNPAPGLAERPQPSALSSKADAVRDVKRGAIAGYVLAAMNALVAWFIYDTGYGVNEAAGEDRIRALARRCPTSTALTIALRMLDTVPRCDQVRSATSPTGTET